MRGRGSTGATTPASFMHLVASWFETRGFAALLTMRV
jgi:hypothetical protein